jgi:hypothetical protein
MGLRKGLFRHGAGQRQHYRMNLRYGFSNVTETAARSITVTGTRGLPTFKTRIAALRPLVATKWVGSWSLPLDPEWDGARNRARNRGGESRAAAIRAPPWVV